MINIFKINSMILIVNFTWINKTTRTRSVYTQIIDSESTWITKASCTSIWIILDITFLTTKMTCLTNFLNWRIFCIPCRAKAWIRYSCQCRNSSISSNIAKTLIALIWIRSCTFFARYMAWLTYEYWIIIKTNKFLSIIFY